jgi:2-polyprenyl-6-methoxyphenol hydroxylase-like FAD-dependent oxidoreductase
VNVLVVGAGPAGATTALLLARCGVEVRLVERETSFERVFRGEGLMPSGVDALHQMGLGEIFRSVPGRVVLSWNIWIDGEEVFVIPEPVEELGERAMRVVSQPALLRRIVEEAGDTRRSRSSGGRGSMMWSVTEATASSVRSWRRRAARERCGRI